MTFVASSMPDRDWWSALFPDPEGLLRKMGVRRGICGKPGTPPHPLTGTP